MRKNKKALCTALVSLSSDTTILRIRSELERGIEGAFRLGLGFEFDNLNSAVIFDDLCFYFSPELKKIISVFVYPGSTMPHRLKFPGTDLPFNGFELEEFCGFLDDSRVNFEESDLNADVSYIELNGIVFYFDQTSQDRRIDITHSSVAALVY